jgi:hypothetical protein
MIRFTVLGYSGTTIFGPTEKINHSGLYNTKLLLALTSG